jgi:hypothetical protein
MQTPQQPPTPATPPTTPPPGAGAGAGLSGLGQFIDNTVNAALSSAQTAVQEELANAISARDVTQAKLDVATSSRERATLTRQLAAENKKIGDLQSGLAKIQAGEAKAAAKLAGGTLVPNQQNINDIVPTTMIVSVMTILFIGFPLSIAFARIMYKRAVHNFSAPKPAPLAADATRRFDQLEQAVDSIAIEIERISEGQRYLTKVLSEPRIGATSEPSKPVS